MEKKYINFVLTGDKNYIIPITVAITSILINMDKSRICRFFLFTTDFNESDINIIQKLKKKYNFELINIDMNNYKDFFDKMDISTFKNKYISLATYYRLLMFKILPEDVDKCFYIDGDMIVYTDLLNIYDNLTEDKLAAVVVEPLAMQHRKSILSHCYEIEDFKNFQKDALKYPYFNAGFFLVNIKLAKELNIFEKMFDFLNRHPNPPYADQDILNAIIGQKYSNLINYLEPSYNIFCDIDYEQPFNDALYNEEIIKKSFKNPKVYHYAGANKPWINTKVANYYDIWWKYLKLSPYRKMKNPKKNKIIGVIENDRYKIYKILFIKIIFKKKPRKENKPTKSNIDTIGWWIPIKSLRDSIRNIYMNIKNNLNQSNSRIDNLYPFIENGYSDIHKKFDDLYTYVENRLSDFHNSVKNMILSSSIHPKIFTKYLNVNKNKDVVLIATGPTLNNYIPIRNCVNVGVNHAFKYNKVDLDYLFIQDNKALTYNELKDSVNYGISKCIKFYGIISDREIERTIPKKIYENSDCNIYIVERAWTPFETFNYNISILPLPSFGSIAFAALNFIAWTHPKRIFLVGCDCSAGGHFVDNKDTSHYGYMLYGWNQAKLFLSYHYPDIEIISINPIGLKGMFKDIYSKDGKYFDDDGKEFIF
ncbi:glycosyltransferase family 8 protein [Brachyspira aalborgi]|uniref:Glycosyltransferase family 8 protein n=1 Tax=Brachyspira aalborgi TaxID=29522 RepID=A0A5C8ENV6_9SPIR|nr:glycosyltransferase family 8 protein [Brachyspira aalborgi]TXJ39535.1 glycosyltransferase family 8 protein [Brachyspira aalborgi]